MVYSQNIPKIDILDQLAAKISTFPDSAFHIGNIARDLGYEQEILAFLRLFDPYHIFSSKKEFIDDCEELEIILNQALESESK